jgi:hypothetical protein
LKKVLGRLELGNIRKEKICIKMGVRETLCEVNRTGSDSCLKTGAYISGFEPPG